MRNTQYEIKSPVHSLQGSAISKIIIFACPPISVAGELMPGSIEKSSFFTPCQLPILKEAYTESIGISPDLTKSTT